MTMSALMRGAFIFTRKKFDSCNLENRLEKDFSVTFGHLG